MFILASSSALFYCNVDSCLLNFTILHVHVPKSNKFTDFNGGLFCCHVKKWSNDKIGYQFFNYTGFLQVSPNQISDFLGPCRNPVTAVLTILDCLLTNIFGLTTAECLTMISARCLVHSVPECVFVSAGRLPLITQTLNICVFTFIEDNDTIFPTFRESFHWQYSGRFRLREI